MTRPIALAMALAACTHHPSPAAPDAQPGDAGAPFVPSLGAHWAPDGSGVVFRVASTNATRVELDVFDQPTQAAPLLALALAQDSTDTWTATIPAAQLPATIYYGYRVWGPNWTYDASWTPGSTAGYLADVDSAGNRMNPNKLVWDPYAVELSHDPQTPDQASGAPYATGGNRAIDSAPVAPKAIVLHDVAPDIGVKPTRAFRDDVVYEVHVRGFTQADAQAGSCAGTYAGAATRAGYLASLGVTAIELMPLAETQNDRNDVAPTDDNGDNYWGYSTLAYFAPDRRYACDRSPGGPTRELRAMVKAFHAVGIKVMVDVVYNHTAEGGSSSLLSLRGLDNAGYYQLDASGAGFVNSNGVGADLAAQKPLVRGLVFDSLRYWSESLGFDGFRFDLAPVLGNRGGSGGFVFDPTGLPTQIATLARPPDGGAGVDLVAEPWAVAGGSYAIGKFPAGWSEWNDHIRDTVRQAQNQLGVAAISPGALASRIAGSSDLFDHDGRAPVSGVSYLVSHDGFTLHDLYACNAPSNNQAWPFGPSNGGSTSNYSWDQGGDATAQRQAVRTGLALELLAAGVPMIEGGDELGRGVACNNNPYNLDSTATWLDWSSGTSTPLWTFAAGMLQFRAAHPALRPASWTAPTFYDPSGGRANDAYMADASQPVVAWLVDGTHVSGEPSKAIFALYNRSAVKVSVTLPAAPVGTSWYRVANTAAFLETSTNITAPGAEVLVTTQAYDLDARALALLIAK